MTLKERLNEDLRAALRSGDEVRKVTIRGALAAIRSAEDAAVQARFEAAEAAGTELSEDEVADARSFDDAAVLQILQRQVKQRRDSIDAFKKAGRQDLIDKESAEIAVIEEYLPQRLGRDEIAAEARAVIAETGASGPSDKGKVMPLLIKRLGDRAEGRTINEVVTELLAARAGG